MVEGLTLNIVLMLVLLGAAVRGFKEGAMTIVAPLVSAILAFLLLEGAGSAFPDEFSSLILGTLGRFLGEVSGSDANVSIYGNEVAGILGRATGKNVEWYMAYLLTFAIFAIALRLVMSSLGILSPVGAVAGANRAAGAILNMVKWMCIVWLILAMLKGYELISDQAAQDLFDKSSLLRVMWDTNPFLL